MNLPEFQFQVTDSSAYIPSENIRAFDINANIFQTYPSLKILISDLSGVNIHHLALQPGNIIKISAIETQESTEDPVPIPYRELNYYIITDIELQGSKVQGTDVPIVSNDAFAGGLVITATHPWGVFSDYNNKAYKGICSDIVKEVVQSPQRGFQFNKIYISTTDDSGQIIRYKVAQSDSSFIINNVLPYSTVQGNAVICFVNELGEFYFTDFKTLYEQDHPLNLALIPSEIGSTVLIPKEAKKVYQYRSLSVSLGLGNQTFSFFKPSIILEDQPSQTSFRLYTSYKPPIDGFMFMRNTTIGLTRTSDLMIYPFRDFEDAVRCEKNRAQYAYSYFTIAVTTDFIGHLVGVGWPVTLAIPDPEKPDKLHWLSGKYLIADMHHSMTSSSDASIGRDYVSTLNLIRPAWSIDPALGIGDLPTVLKPELLFNFKEGT